MRKISKEGETLKDLRQIRELLTAKLLQHPHDLKDLNVFKSFIENYKVMRLAVAFILGMYLGQLVQSMVTDLIIPVIGLALPVMDNMSTTKISVYNRVRNWRLSSGADNGHDHSVRNPPVNQSHQ